MNPTQKPIPVTDAIRLIQLHKGEVWRVSREPHATTVRATIGPAKKNALIIVPILGPNWNVKPPQGRLPYHIVRNLDEFRTWLTTLAGKEGKP